MRFKYAIPAVFLIGPTASGKTETAIELTDKFPFEIISIDSAMVYKDMDMVLVSRTRIYLSKPNIG